MIGLIPSYDHNNLCPDLGGNSMFFIFKILVDMEVMEQNICLHIPANQLWVY